MIGEDYKAGVSYKFRVPLRDASGALRSGKSPSLAVYRPDDTPDPGPPTVTEIGSSGIYGFTYTPAAQGCYTFAVTATDCLPVVWNIQVRGQSRDDLAPAATALSNIVWTDARAARLDNLDATVSSRAPAGEYDTQMARLDAPVSSRAAPGDAMALTTDERTSLISGIWSAANRTLTSFGSLVEDIANAVWSATSRTLSSFGTLVADTAAAVWQYATRVVTGGNVDYAAALSSDYDAAKTAASGTVWTEERAQKLDRLDVAVSSRAPAGEYDVPMARLDVAVSSRAAPGDAMSLTPAERATLADAVLDEDVQGTPATANSLRAAAKAAWAQGFGKWSLSGTTLTLFGPDGVTPVRVFLLDDPDSPRERVPA